MGTVINKTTKEIRRSVHTAAYEDGNWINNPVFPDCEEKYYKIDGETVVEMTADEKATVDSDLAAIAASVTAAAEREALIQARIKKIAEDQLIAEGVIIA